MDLDGRVALVTGAGTGLGRQTALRLAEQGALVAVNYSKSRSSAERVVREIEDRGSDAIAVRADVSDGASVASMVESVQNSLGPVDIVINNSGMTSYVPFPKLEAVTHEVWRRIMDVNVMGAFLCSQAAAPGMRGPRRAGKIVNVASNSAFSHAGEFHSLRGVQGRSPCP